MNSPTEPERAESTGPTAPSRDIDRSQGLGAIVAVVAVAAVIIAAMLYMMQPPAQAPNRVTSEAPTGASSPAPTPKPNTGQ